MTLAPSVSYSRLVTQIFLNVSNEANMEPLGKEEKEEWIEGIEK